MSSIANYHVIDPHNIGDLLSAPVRYFSFPSFQVEQSDIRQVQPAVEGEQLLDEPTSDQHMIVGGGGLLFPRFLENWVSLAARTGKGKRIAWGVGQQIYSDLSQAKIQSFDYASYLNQFDLVGIRDFGCNKQGYHWVPCASCMHPAFDQKREIQHEFVVFSHKKFQLQIDPFPRMTHEANSLEEVLDFLGSGETILTSSYHGAYWGTLLGRKVLAFPFSSKFYTFKHQPGLYPVQKWQQHAKRLRLFKKTLYEFGYKNKYTCPTSGWQQVLKHCAIYPDSLAENRSRNQWFYERVLDLIN